jgi:hypothetical protein
MKAMPTAHEAHGVRADVGLPHVIAPDDEDVYPPTPAGASVTVAIAASAIQGSTTGSGASGKRNAPDPGQLTAAIATAAFPPAA